MAISAAAATMAFGVAGCGGDNGSGDHSGHSTTIDHAFGQTTIEGVPTRVVALGSQWLDASESLGVTPVGYIDNVSMTNGGAPVPWKPDSLQSSTKIDVQGVIEEQVAALDPDLILAPGFGADKSMLDKLNSLAPTIPTLSTSQVDKWEDQVTVLGKVFHKEDEATKVIDDLGSRIDAIKQQNPSLDGKSFLTAYLASPTQLMVLADPNDGASELFTRLGMQLPQKLVDEAGSAGRIPLSPERIADLNTDLLVATAAPGMEQTFKTLPGYADLPAARNGTLVFLDITSGTGLNVPTPLSLPYVLDRLEPTLTKVGQQQ
ncbi:MAG: ABC transporter substrate-binding protein [Aldersonia sp.]|nr:ABC transporter substrate-binding protein [Aldersonia sp.]